VTVEAPRPDPAAPKRENERREREIAINAQNAEVNRRLAAYTSALAWLTGLQFVVGSIGLFFAIRAANAAKRSAEAAKSSADTADSSFKMSMLAYLGIKDVQLTIAGRDVNHEVSVLKLSYRIFNASTYPIELNDVTIKYTVSGYRSEQVMRTERHSEELPPGKGYQFPLPLEIDETQRRAWNEGRLVVRVRILTNVKDKLDRTSTPEFNRIVICGPGERAQSHLLNELPDSE